MEKEGALRLSCNSLFIILYIWHSTAQCTNILIDSLVISKTSITFARIFLDNG